MGCSEKIVQEKVAGTMMECLPLSVVNVITGGDGNRQGNIISLPESGGIKTSTAKEISANYVFVKPVVMNVPHKAQSVVSRIKDRIIGAYMLATVDIQL